MDLGCGSGLWAEQLIKARYQVLGIDLSEAMIGIARKRAPAARFRVESLHKAKIPPCRAVTSISECLNYLFDSQSGQRTLTQLFGRIYKALADGGLFIFDISEPGQLVEGKTTKGFSKGEDWAVLVEKNERQDIFTRHITSFRKVGNNYRRSEETHIQRLYKAADVLKQLRQAGFRARVTRSYGSYALPKAHAAFIARKSS